MTKNKLPERVKLGYGTTGFAAINTFTVFIMFGMYFFTECVGLDATFAGTILAIGTAWDAITDPLIGYLSDRRDPQKGRRRPFLKFVALPFGIIGWLLFTNFNLGETKTKIYFIIIAILFYTVQTLLDVPYTSLGAEMTDDYDERSSLNSRRNIFATISGIVSSVTLTFVFFFTDIFDSPRIGWSLTGALFSIIAVITIIIGYRSTKGYESTDILKVDRRSSRHMLKDLIKNRPFMYTMGLFATAVISLAIQNSGFVYYLTYNLNLSENEISMAFLMSWIPGLLWVKGIDYLCQKYSKKVAWCVCMTIWAVSLIVFPLFVFPYTTNIILVYVMQILAGVGLVGQYQIAWSMIPDTIEVDEFKTGLRREGSYYGIITFLQKLSTAIAMFISGKVLTVVGYVPNVKQSHETLEGIKYLISLGGTFFLAISIVLAILNPMSRERHKALKEAIKLKKQGKPVDTSEFKELL